MKRARTLDYDRHLCWQACVKLWGLRTLDTCGVVQYCGQYDVTVW